MIGAYDETCVNVCVMVTLAFHYDGEWFDTSIRCYSHGIVHTTTSSEPLPVDYVVDDSVRPWPASVLAARAMKIASLSSK